MAKRYTFSVVVEEGSDEFWESIKDRSGCDEVLAEVIELIESGGQYICSGEYKNCSVTLSKFDDGKLT